MVLNPLQPQLEPFDWALSYHGLIPFSQLAGLMETAPPPSAKEAGPAQLALTPPPPSVRIAGDGFEPATATA